MDGLNALLDSFRGYGPLELALELSLIWLVVWATLRFLRRSSGAGVIRGFAVLIIVFAIVLRLTSDDNDTLARVRFLSDRVVSLVAIMLVVVFQPELRQAMITLGQAKLFGRGPSVRRGVVESVADAVDFLAKSQFGAIIVFERSLGLESHKVIVSALKESFELNGHRQRAAAVAHIPASSSRCRRGH